VNEKWSFIWGIPNIMAIVISRIVYFAILLHGFISFSFRKRGRVYLLVGGFFAIVLFWFCIGYAASYADGCGMGEKIIENTTGRCAVAQYIAYIGIVMLYVGVAIITIGIIRSRTTKGSVRVSGGPKVTYISGALRYVKSMSLEMYILILELALFLSSSLYILVIQV